MRYKLVTTIFFLLSSSIQSYAQQDTLLEINKISFEGLLKTKSSYLHNVIKTKNGESYNQENIAEDLRRLRNLASIASADYVIDTFNNAIHLKFTIEERRTALPIVQFGGIKGNLWFSLGFTENNLRGNGDVALAYYQNNAGLHSALAHYRKPRIKNSKWGFGVSANKWSSEEPLYFDEGLVNYLYNNDGATLTGIRHFGFNRRIELGTTYFIERYSRSTEQNLLNPPGPNDFSITKFLSKLELHEHYLSYNSFYLTGREFVLNYQNVFNFDDKSWFNSLQFQSKIFFKPSNKLNIATRFKLAISNNDDSPFAPFVADSHVNIRGIGNRIDRGTAQAVLNLELRITSFHARLWANQIILFSDSGTWRNPGGSLSQLFDRNQFRQFVGIGTRIIYQKVFGAIIRIDYGLDIFNKDQRGFVIGLGQYF